MLKEEEFGNRIKYIRIERGLSQSQVARVAGMDTTRYSKFETGEYTNPTLETIERIAAGLGCPPHVLLPSFTKPIKFTNVGEQRKKWPSEIKTYIKKLIDILEGPNEYAILHIKWEIDSIHKLRKMWGRSKKISAT